MKTLFHRWIRDEGGATAIEYGLILAMIFLAIVGAVQLFAGNSTGLFNRAMATINAAIG
ncbi:MAG: Flp family type IVb pilin [Brevundimonas sp.]|uniref:Flp family type IVb pilin n=1 Tax=Brevundimonas sp. TaxID=1871086 RepID=UPI002732E3DF|nr:Flp family type IVb pilin [Brevundimonas sp.]MDP3403371.1 Flp family type IVb pilin [Brevundimonas sp.]